MLSLRDQLSIAGFVWGIKGEELRVYTASGGLIVLSVTPSNGGLSLALVLDESKEFLEEVLEIQPEEDKAGEGKEKDDEEEEEEADSDDRKIVIYGASGSPNNIFDMVVYTTYNANDMTYKVYSHERCKILIRPGYESDDAEIMNDILVRFNGLVPWSISRGKRINSKILWDIIQRFGASHFKEDVPFMNRFRLELNLRDATGMEAVSLVESIDDLYREIFQDPDVQVSTLVSYSLLSQPALREEKVQGLQVLYFSRLLELLRENFQTLERQDFLTIYFVSDWFLRNQAVLSPLRVQVEDLLKTLSTKAPSEDERMSINRQLDRVISGSTDMLEARESCPACREPIRLESLSEASCPNGHIWSRCSLSLGLIGTPTFRSCSGCHVQCKVPDANDTSFTSQILRRFNACILCGCSFQKRGFEFPA